MKNLKINLVLLCNGSKESYQLYLNYLVNVVVSYLLLKGYTVLVPGNADTKQMHAILCLDQVWISLYDCFFNYDFNIKELEYYLKVFLNQEVAPNEKLDAKLIRVLGELYPLHHKVPNILVSTNKPDDIYLFLSGFISNGFSNLWCERIFSLDNWLQELKLPFNSLIQQELFELAVANVKTQNFSYFVFYDLYWMPIQLKLTKEQYLRFLRYFICSNYFRKTDDVYVDILKGNVISQASLDPGEFQHMTFHAVFPKFLQNLM